MKDKFITKIRLFASLDKELDFINKMNALGYKLVFVQLGIFYKFKKVDYNDGFTIIHATDKTKISDMSSAALLGGYDIVQHTCDGLGNFLYLAGRKGKADEDFISDNEGKLMYYKTVKSYYRFSAMLTFAAFFACIFPFLISLSRIIFILQNYELLGSNKIPTTISIVGVSLGALLGVIFLMAFIRIIILYVKTNKKCKKIVSDMSLYE